MDKDQAGRMQMQLRHNAEDLQSYLCGLDSWEKEMKLKDESLRKKKPILKEVGVAYCSCSCHCLVQILNKVSKSDI